MTEPPFSRVGIIGLGLIGGSIALSARRAWAGLTLVGLDRSRETADAARGPVVHQTAAQVDDLADCDLIILAVPPVAMMELVPAVGRLDTHAVVTDVGSTKRDVMEASVTGGLRRFVGGHPMAGSERDGLEHARADLFEGRPWLLVAGTANAADRARVETFVAGLGGLPRWLEAAAHDRAVAYTSHLPQILAVALMNAAEGAVGGDGRAVSGRAFAEMTRLASSPAGLWQEILATNADYVAEALKQFVANLPQDGQLDDAQWGRWVRDAFKRAGEAKSKDRGRRTKDGETGQ